MNSAGENGLFYPSLVLKPLIAIVATYLFFGIVSYILIKLVKVFVRPCRENEQEESLGLDIKLHGKKAYHDA